MSRAIVGKSSNVKFASKIADRPFTTITLYVQGSLLGFVPTKLRVHSEASLDAIYRVIETSALGTLSRKHFYFVLEDKDRMLSACAAYLTHYKSSDVLKTPLGVPKLLQRRSFKRLKGCFGTDHSFQLLNKLLWESSFESFDFSDKAGFPATVKEIGDQESAEKQIGSKTLGA
jgi:hypothetical protein